MRDAACLALLMLKVALILWFLVADSRVPDYIQVLLVWPMALSGFVTIVYLVELAWARMMTFRRYYDEV